MFYTSKLMAKHGVKALFSDRSGGCSQGSFDSLNLGLDLGDSSDNVMQNLEVLCQASGMPTPHQAKQIHGIQVLRCQGFGEVHPQEADILMATDINVVLAIRTADCLPILLVDKKAKVAAAVHAGWRGTVEKVAEIAVDEMCRLGATPENILASLGPCIDSCCFEVNEDIGRLLSQSCGEKVTIKKGASLFADLKKTNASQLLTCGLTQEHIELSGACTACQISPAYFSYRRDKGKTGRQLAMISLL